jgi:hypothetical protein
VSMTARAARKWTFGSVLRRLSRPTPSRTVMEASRSARCGVRHPSFQALTAMLYPVLFRCRNKAG